MPYLISALSASVASFLISAFTSKPAITVETGQSKSETQLLFFKWGFFALAGYIATKILKKAVR